MKIEKNQTPITPEMFFSNAENINRACSTLIENSITVFLPYKHLGTNTKIQKKFYANNQILKIENRFFSKVEIRGRLLGQHHKDILEALLTTKKTFDPKKHTFKIKTTAYNILKKLGKSTGNKKWLIQKLDEIKECGVKIYFSEDDGDSFNFGFISSIFLKNNKDLVINFTEEYTHFMATNELLDYSNYVNRIIEIDKIVCHTTKNGLQKRLERNINTSFIKTVVRYMLTHRGKSENKSQVSISKFIETLKIDNVMEEKELHDAVKDLKRVEVKDFLKENFGITLTNKEQTITFEDIHSRCLIQPNLL